MSSFFSKKFRHICVSLDVNFNESLTNDVVSFEQLGPDIDIFNSHFQISKTVGLSKISKTVDTFHLNRGTGLFTK